MHTNDSQHEYTLRELRSRLALSDESRARMRTHLSAYADFHAIVEGTAPVRAGAFEFLKGMRWPAPAAAIFALVLMAGTSYASEKALPGDTLYMVKIRVVEPLSLTLAPSVEGRATVRVELAERRLTEAAKLAVNTRLDPSTGDFLEKEFSAHVDKSLEAADELQATGKSEESLEIRTNLEAKLVAHADILDLVEDHLDDTGNELVRVPTQELLNEVNLRKEVVSETRVALEKDLEDMVTPTQTLALVTKTDAAVPKVESAAATTPKSAANRISEAATALTAAKESLESSDPEDTKRAFHEAREAELKTEVATTILENKDVLEAIGHATTTPPAATTTPPASAQ